jgi:hypothetical protein
MACDTTLLCQDGATRLLPETLAACSTLQDVLVDGTGDVPLPLPVAVMQLVQEFCAAPTQFRLPLHVGVLCLLTEAANFLGCEPLLQLAVRRHADIIQQHTPAELRQLYCCPNDLTPADLEGWEALHIATHSREPPAA